MTVILVKSSSERSPGVELERQIDYTATSRHLQLTLPVDSCLSCGQVEGFYRRGQDLPTTLAPLSRSWRMDDDTGRSSSYYELAWEHTK
jgi:hypothetical protein